MTATNPMGLPQGVAEMELAATAQMAKIADTLALLQQVDVSSGVVEDLCDMYAHVAVVRARCSSTLYIRSKRDV